MSNVIRPETKTGDRKEKLLAYKSLPTLQTYILIEQDRVQITVFRRTTAWSPEHYVQLEEKVALDNLNLVMNVRSIYEHTGLQSYSW